MNHTLRTHRRVFRDLPVPTLVMSTDGDWWMNRSALELLYRPDYRHRPYLDITLRRRGEPAASRVVTLRSVLEDAREGRTVNDAEFDLELPVGGREVTVSISIHQLRGRRAQPIGLLAFFCDQSPRTRRDRELAAAAHLDPLTGVANRRGLEASLTRVRTRTVAPGVAVMIVDVDHFHQCNDRFGHEAGDAVLARVSERLVSIVGEHGAVIRLGDDEFVVVSPVQGEPEALTLAEELQRRIRLPVPYRNVSIEVTVSIGLTVMPAVHETAGITVLLEAADHALGEAKRLGRNRVVTTGWFGPA